MPSSSKISKFSTKTEESDKNNKNKRIMKNKSVVESRDSSDDESIVLYELDDDDSSGSDNYETFSENDSESSDSSESEYIVSPKKKTAKSSSKGKINRSTKEKYKNNQKHIVTRQQTKGSKTKIKTLNNDNKKPKKEHTSIDEDDDEDEDEDEDEEDDEDDEDEDEDYDEDYDEDEDENDIRNENLKGDKKSSKHSPGIILSFDAFGGGSCNTDQVDYKEMMKEDQNEICDSEDERTFMKERYENLTSNEKSDDNIKLPEKKTKIKMRKLSQKMEDENSSDVKSEDEKTVESKYLELFQLKKDLVYQLNASPNSKILKNAIQECRTSIAELVKKERQKNTKTYYKLVSKEQDKKNTNELSYFKKKLSHKEQLKVVKDLTEINAFANTDKPYRLALLETDIPAKFKAVALQKLNVLKSMEPSDSEYYKMKNWVDGFMRVPYGIYNNLNVNISDGLDVCHGFIENAKTQLDTCVYGLNDAKLQILQMVGQWITNPSAMGTAIAIKGPMGTGKTTLVKDGISKILGREFAFIALGGTGDSSFLEGHSYTYEGSSWGKIVSILMDSKCMNPVIYFDELDKISDTPRGEEIVSILTHLTDTTQNSQFHDKYFSEVDFDLSKCLFIFSYNDEEKVNPILRDRMYRIQTKGYDAKEKVIIARRHLLPKIREQVNFTETDVVISDDTLQYIIGNERFSNGEQGVRNLKRCLEIIHTKLNLFRLVKPDIKLFDNDMKLNVSFPFTVTKEHVELLIKRDDTVNQSMLSMYV